MPLPRYNPSILRSARGGFDLPSVIVGVIVVGILAAGTFAAVFGAIPWAQDRAAKQDLASLTVAEGAAKSVDGQFAGPALMSEFGYLGDDAGLDYAVSDDASCYVGVAKAATGKTFYTVNGSDPEELTRETEPECLKGIKYEKISTGLNSSCGISDGDLYCWGQNDWGHLGDGTTKPSSIPVRAAAGELAGKRIANVVVGKTHTCATDTGGTLYCWGANANGQTGNGLSGTRQHPVAVRGLLTGKKVTHFSVTQGRTCAVADGLLYCWGRGNANGTMGDSADTAESRAPLLIDGGALKGVAVESSTLETYGSCALSVGGKAYCWGGLAPPGTSSTEPAAVDMSAVEGGKFEQLGAGTGFACGIGGSKVYCWGHALKGQLGMGSTFYAKQPQTVPGMVDAERISVWSRGACAGGPSGAHCWGAPWVGTYGGNSGASTPTLIPASGSLPSAPASVTVDGQSLCTLRDGAAHCAGDPVGSPGHGTASSPATFVKVSDPVDAKTWVDIVLDGGKLP